MTMNKETQDLAWVCLPKEVREEMKETLYDITVVDDFHKGYKQALYDFFGHHNLTSDTEPEEMLMVERKKVISKYKSAERDYESAKDSSIKKVYSFGRKSLLKYLFGDKCLSDTPDFSSLAKTGKDEESKLKFDIGQKVRAKGTKQIGTIKEPYPNDVGYRVYFEDGDGGWDKEYSADDLEPYTEENEKNCKETQNLSLSEEQTTENKEPMEEKELNLIEILKDCPKGEMFFSLIAGNVIFQGVDSHWEQEAWKPIRCTGGDYNSD
ncbi:MAG: hypothetical protein K2G69_07000, partial [Muribaculaceae bacterium]|nr:hypothetical protein [Muribaculaceae bacterium]